ncbi:MAG TPA: CoA transferase [Azospirillaceae bacterium]|nr:CoA transferase [Azospirillaceae bacterium]
MSLPLPLDGVRVLAVEQYGAGPWGTLYLADMGAEVIKIEQPGSGDMSRGTGPHFLGDNDSEFFQTFNRNKRSLTLDLKDRRGREIFEKLAARADGVANNLRGDQPGKLGLTYEVLGKINPKLVCAHLSAYGRTGARAGWPGYDYLMQAEAGFMDLTGEPDSPPTRMGLSVVDYMTGVTMAYAFTAALVQALKTGRGRDVDVSLFDVALHQLTYPATWYLNSGDLTRRRPRSGHPSTVPVELFPTADGYVFIMCVTQKFWELLCQRTGLDHLAADPRFLKPADRRTNREALIAILDERLRQRTTAEWLEIFAGDIPSAPVHTLDQALANPWLAERGHIQPHPHPAKPDMRMIANPIRLDDAFVPVKAAPALGADTDAILGELGLGADDIRALKEAKVV